MGKADEERLAIGVQKYPCFYDKAVSAFHNKNQKKNAREAVAKDIGLEKGEAAKTAFTSVRTKYVSQKKTLKDLNRCRKSNESRKGHAGISFSQLVGQFCVRKKQ